MKAYRFAIGLTVINLFVLMGSLFHADSATPKAAGEPSQVIRGKALEIVDDQGRVRASIGILPADPEVKMPDGTIGYPETVLLRLIDANGRPSVKIAAMEDGTGISLCGKENPTYMQLIARGDEPGIKFVSKNGEEKMISPK